MTDMDSSALSFFLRVLQAITGPSVANQERFDQDYEVPVADCVSHCNNI